MKSSTILLTSAPLLTVLYINIFLIACNILLEGKRRKGGKEKRGKEEKEKRGKEEKEKRRKGEKKK